MHSLLHLLLISCVAVCPFNCLGKAAGASAPSSSGEKACCKRCADCGPQDGRDGGNRSSKSAPDAPGGEGCCQCLCKGAIAQKDGPQVDAAAPGELFPAPLDLTAHKGRLPVVSLEDSSRTPRLGAWLAGSGRALRVRIESLLI